MSGRGKGLLSKNIDHNCNVSGRDGRLIVDKEALRRPGSADGNFISSIDEIVNRIMSVTSPDDMELSNSAKEIKTSVTEEISLSDLIDKLYERGLDHRESTPVIAEVCSLVAQHQVGETKMLKLLLRKLQTSYESKDELESVDRVRFVTSSLFLGEIYHRCKNTNGSPIEVLTGPVVEYLQAILKAHLSSDPGCDINEEMMVIAKELLQSGRSLFKFKSDELMDLVNGVTEAIVRHRCHLSDVCLLNLLASLADLWPVINTFRSPRTTHATLAAKLGLSLNV